jgi:hypothetical protein
MPFCAVAGKIKLRLNRKSRKGIFFIGTEKLIGNNNLLYKFLNIPVLKLQAIFKILIWGIFFNVEMLCQEQHSTWKTKKLFLNKAILEGNNQLPAD